MLHHVCEIFGRCAVLSQRPKGVSSRLGRDMMLYLLSFLFSSRCTVAVGPTHLPHLAGGQRTPVSPQNILPISQPCPRTLPTGHSLSGRPRRHQRALLVLLVLRRTASAATTNSTLPATRPIGGDDQPGRAPPVGRPATERQYHRGPSARLLALLLLLLRLPLLLPPLRSAGRNLQLSDLRPGPPAVKSGASSPQNTALVTKLQQLPP